MFVINANNSQEDSYVSTGRYGKYGGYYAMFLTASGAPTTFCGISFCQLENPLLAEPHWFGGGITSPSGYWGAPTNGNASTKTRCRSWLSLGHFYGGETVGKTINGFLFGLVSAYTSISDWGYCVQVGTIDLSGVKHHLTTINCPIGSSLPKETSYNFQRTVSTTTGGRIVCAGERLYVCMCMTCCGQACNCGYANLCFFLGNGGSFGRCASCSNAAFGQYFSISDNSSCRAEPLLISVE